jgi:hypothetical protein
MIVKVKIKERLTVAALIAPVACVLALASKC